MSFLALATITAGVLAVSFLGLWVVSLAKRDVSIVDLYWGPAFGLVAWLGFALGGASGHRPGLVAVLVTIWGLRLGLHLYFRNRGQPEDHRYGAMRANHGARFGRVSLYTVFLLQAGLVLLISTPLQLLSAAGADPELGPLDALAAGMVLLGIVFETVADAQLTRFRRDPRSRGRVLDTGLWRYSRHPNYFGDAVVWWGLGLFGVASDAWPSVFGPALMTFLLLKVSGVSLLEQTIQERRPEYAAYIARTAAFFPWKPRHPAGALVQ